MERDRYIAPDINAVTELLQQGKVRFDQFYDFSMHEIFV